MTKNIGVISLANNFANLVTYAQTIGAVLANEIVTANSAAGGGALSVGSGFVVGIFGANTIVANTIQGGNVTSTTTLYLGSNLGSNVSTITCGANLTINASGVFGTNTTANLISVGNTTVNLNITTAQLSLGNSTANAVVNSTGYYFDNVLLSFPIFFTSTTSGAGTFTVDNWGLGTYHTVKYVVQVTDNNNSNNIESAELLVLNAGGTNQFLTEYATVTSNGAMGGFSVSSNATSVLVQWSPSSSNTTVKGYRLASIVP